MTSPGRLPPWVIMVLGTLAAAASGCVQEDGRITLNPDGSGKFRFELTYDPKVAARAAQGMGQSPEAVRAMLPDLETMLYSTVGGARGVDVWSEARIESDPDGKARIIVAGYFESISGFGLGNPFATTAKSVETPPSPLDFGIPRFVADSAGIAVLEFMDRDTTSEAPPRFPDTTSALTEAQRSRLEEGRMAMSVSLAMMMSLFKDARFHREFAFSGEVIDAGLFNKVDAHRVQVDASMARLFASLADLFRDERIGRRLILGGREVEGEPFALLQGAVKDPEVDSLTMVAVFGRVAPTRVTLRPGKARFDYASERAAAAAGQSARLREVLSRARASSGEGAVGIEVEKPEFNFALRVPPGWARFAAEQLQPAACLGLRQGTSRFALVIAESSQTTVSLEALEGAVRARVATQPGSRYRTHPHVTIGGRRIGHASATLVGDNTGTAMHFEYWLASHQRFCWQLVVFGPAAESTEVATGARTLVEGFRILDTARTAQFTTPAADVDRPQYGYALRGMAGGWGAEAGSDTDTSSTRSPLADLFWSREDEAVMVLPIRFEGPPPDLPALTRGLLGTLDFDYPAGGVYDRVPWEHPLGEAIEIRTERKGDDERTWRVRLRVVRGKRVGFLVAGWHEKTHGDSARVRRVLDAVELHEPRGTTPSSTKAQEVARAGVLNSVGLAYFSRQAYGDAHRWFKTAFDLAPDEPVYLMNTVGALRRADRSREGLDYLSGRIERFADHSGLRLLLAQLRLDTGDAERGNRDFLEALRLGHSDEDDLFDWLQDLVRTDHAQLAIAAGTAWVERYPTVKPRRWLAQVVRESGDLPRAIAMMRELVAEFPDSPDLASDLGSTLNTAGDYAQAAAAAQAYIDRHGPHSELLLVIGWSQMGRKWYREAKVTFQQAAKLAPDDPDVTSSIAEASRLLGQGEDAPIRARIEPVPIPAEVERVLRTTIPSEFGKGYPAIIRLEAHGYAVEPGKPVRRTDHLHVRVLTEEGAGDYSTLQFEFQPSAQRAFINRIEVRDAGGKVVSRASADDAYLIDDRQHPESDDKILHVPLRGVSPGATIESEVTFEERTPGPELAFTRRLLAGYLPTARTVVYVIGDTARVRAVLRNGADVAVLRNDRMLAWVAQPQRMEKLEPMATLVEDRAPIVSLCKPESSWSAVGWRYLNDIGEVFAKDAALSDLSARLTAGSTSEKDKIARIARYVQQQIHYKAIEFGPRALRPDKPSQVLMQRYGDCKDHALLMRQLLEAAGIRSHLALVNTSWRIETELPSIGQFNHMVVHVPALGEGWLLDATDKYLRLDALPANGLWHSQALVLDTRGPFLLAAREWAPEGSYEMTSDRTIVATGDDWSVEETLTMDGYAAAGFRGWLAGVDTSEQVRRVQAFLGAEGAVHVSEFRCDALSEASMPAVAKLRYTVKNAVEDRPGGNSAAIPALLEQQYLGRPFVVDRKNDFEISYPLHLRTRIRLRLPKRPIASAAQPPRTIQNAYCVWTLSSTAGPREQEFDVQLDFQALTGRHPPQRYAEMQEAWQAPVRALGRRLEW